MPFINLVDDRDHSCLIVNISATILAKFDNLHSLVDDHKLRSDVVHDFIHHFYATKQIEFNIDLSSTTRTMIDVMLYLANGRITSRITLLFVHFLSALRSSYFPLNYPQPFIQDILFQEWLKCHPERLTDLKLVPIETYLSQFGQKELPGAVRFSPSPVSHISYAELIAKLDRILSLVPELHHEVKAGRLVLAGNCFLPLIINSRASHFDFYIVDESDRTNDVIINDLYLKLRRLNFIEAVVFSSSINFTVSEYRFEVILRRYHSLAQVVLSYNIGLYQLAYDGQVVYGTNEAVASMMHYATCYKPSCFPIKYYYIASKGVSFFMPSYSRPALAEQVSYLSDLLNRAHLCYCDITTGLNSKGLETLKIDFGITAVTLQGIDLFLFQLLLRLRERRKTIFNAVESNKNKVIANLNQPHLVDDREVVAFKLNVNETIKEYTETGCGDLFKGIPDQQDSVDLRELIRQAVFDRLWSVGFGFQVQLLPPFRNNGIFDVTQHDHCLDNSYTAVTSFLSVDSKVMHYKVSRNKTLSLLAQRQQVIGVKVKEFGVIRLAHNGGYLFCRIEGLGGELGDKLGGELGDKLGGELNSRFLTSIRLYCRLPLVLLQQDSLILILMKPLNSSDNVTMEINELTDIRTTVYENDGLKWLKTADLNLISLILEDITSRLGLRSMKVTI